MSKPKTLLEDLCAHALSCGAQSIDVEHKDGREWVIARKGETSFGTANFASSSRDAKELRENLYAARKKSVRTAQLLAWIFSRLTVWLRSSRRSKIQPSAKVFDKRSS